MTGLARPRWAAPGARVRVVAPAGPVRDRAGFDAGLALLGQRFQVELDPGVRAAAGYLAGEDARRADELQRALDDAEARVVIAARGGFGTTRILDRLTYDGFAASPKWIVGSSDVTALLVDLWARLRVTTIHGPMVERLARAPGTDAEELLALVEGRGWTAPAGLRSVRDGAATGPLIGGNLTILAHLVGTIEASVTDGAILFLEEVGEQTYRVDRALVQLARAGWLDGVRGIVLGEFTDCGAGADGGSVDDLLAERLGALPVPVARSYPAAHGTRNHPFVHGGRVELRCADGGATLRSSVPA